MHKFLSDDWFSALKKLNDRAGDLPMPPTLQHTVINMSLTDDTPVALHLRQGKLYQGHSEANTTILTDRETLALLIANKNSDSLIEAFMTGKIRVEGDMSVLLSLQSARPSDEQKTLYKSILAMTEF